MVVEEAALWEVQVEAAAAAVEVAEVATAEGGRTRSALR